MQTTEGAVAQNVRRLRETQRLTVRALSARLADAGRPILPSGITKIEDGSRRVGVGDLVALAEVFGVSPVTLLMPAEPARDEHETWSARWRWMHAEAPLPGSEIDQEEFRRTNRPYEHPNPQAAAMARIAEATQVLAPVLADRMSPGVNHMAITIDGEWQLNFKKPIEFVPVSDGDDDAGR